MKLINAAVKKAKKEIENKYDLDEWYGLLESEIDELLYERRFQKEVGISRYPKIDGAEGILEKLIFKAIRKATRKAHPCDPRRNG